MKYFRPAIALLATTLSLNLWVSPGRSQTPAAPPPTAQKSEELPRKDRIAAARAELLRLQSSQDQTAIHRATYNLAWQLNGKENEGGDRKEAIKLYENLLRIYPKNKFPAQAAEILRDLADCYYEIAAELSDNNSDKKKEMEPAIANYQAAGQIFQQLNDTVEVAKTFSKLGTTYKELERYQQAIGAYTISQKMFQRIRFPFWDAWTLSKIGDCYRALDDAAGNETDQAIMAYQQALTVWQTGRSTSQQIPIYKGINPNFRKNDFSMSLGMSTSKGLFLNVDTRFGDNLYNDIAKDNLLWQALTMFNLARTYQEVGDTPQALVLYQEVQRILPTAIQSNPVIAKIDPQYRADAASLLQGFMSIPLSQTYYNLGSDGEAEKYQKKAEQGISRSMDSLLIPLLKKSQGAENSQLVATLLPLGLGLFQNLSTELYDKIKLDDGKSAASEQALNGVYATLLSKEAEIQQVWQDISAKITTTPEQRQQFQPLIDGVFSYALELKGDYLAKNKQYETALSNYVEAVRIHSQGQEASASIDKLLFGVLKSSLPANDSQNTQLGQLKKGIGPVIKSAISPAKIYNSIGNTLLKLDRFPTAIESYKQAVTIAQRDNKPEVGAEAYLLLGRAYATENQAQVAIAHYEKAIPLWKEAKNALREAETHWEIATVHRTNGNFPQAQIAVETAIDRIESQQAQSKNNDTKTADKDNPQPISNYTAYLNLATYLASKQNYYDFYIDLLMDRHQKSPSSGYDIQAFSASERSHAKSLRAMLGRAQGLANKPLDTTSAIAIAKIPSLQEVQQRLLDDNSLLLEYALGEKRSYLWVVSKQSLKSYVLPPRSQIEPRVQNLIAQITKNTKDFYSDPASSDNIKALSQILLGPIADQLDQKRLLIVADESLQYLPFSALPHPIAQTPMVMQHEILGLPAAATTLAFQARQRQRPNAPVKTLALFADPVFDRTDDRVKTPSSLASIQEIDGVYTRLPGTQSEAEAIARLVPRDKGLFKQGFAANYAAATSEQLKQYRFLHFATHGILNSQYPERSGMVLSLLNERGDLQRSLLSAANTFNLQLSTDLVVLSGCDTSLGKQVNGEGLIGLTSGLMYAGSKQVISTLWPINDRVTAELMTGLYTSILQEQRSPSVALRQAQIKILQNPRTASPYYWAAFGIQGI